MPTEPTVLYDLATESLACVLAQMAARGLTLPQVVYVAAGQPAMDDCCEGWLTARVGHLYLSKEFPVNAVTVPILGNGCDAGQWVADLIVQFARCVPNLDSHGHHPNTTTLDTAGLGAHVYLLALAQGLACCVSGWNESGRDAIFGDVIEDGEPSGNCASWTGTVTVAVWDCPCPDQVAPLVNPPAGVLI